MAFFSTLYMFLASVFLIWFGWHTQELIYGFLALWFMGGAIYAKS